MHDTDSQVKQPKAAQRYSPHEVRVGMRYCMLAWLFGSAFFAVTGGSALYSFLTKYLHTSDATYGIISAIGSVGVLFYVLGSRAIERSGHVKRNFLILVSLHRLLWLGIAAIPLLLPVGIGASSTVQVVIVCAIIVLSAAVANYGGVGWTAWMSSFIPKSIAGKFFGYRQRLGMLSMVVTAYGVSRLLDAVSGTASERIAYVVIFGGAAVLGAIDILLFIPVREIPQPVAGTPPTLLDVLRTPWRDALFRRFAGYTIATWIAYMMMGPFVWRYCLQSVEKHCLGLSVTATTWLLFIIPTLTMAWVAPFWGKAIDRFGPKPVIAVGALGAILAPSGWLFIHSGTTWIIPVIAILGALTWPGIDQVPLYLQLKVFPENRRTTYIAMFQIVFGLSVMTGTLLGGYYATFWEHHLQALTFLPAWLSHYHPVFATSIIIRILAFVFLLPHLPLPARSGKKVVAHTIARDMYTSIPGVAAWQRKRQQDLHER